MLNEALMSLVARSTPESKMLTDILHTACGFVRCQVKDLPEGVTSFDDNGRLYKEIVHDEGRLYHGAGRWIDGNELMIYDPLEKVGNELAWAIQFNKVEKITGILEENEMTEIYPMLYKCAQAGTLSEYKTVLPAELERINGFKRTKDKEGDEPVPTSAD